jgi:hypothetical protein
VKLPNPILYIVSMLLVVNAMFQFQLHNILWGVESLAVSLAAFLLARKRAKEGEDQE